MQKSRIMGAEEASGLRRGAVEEQILKLADREVLTKTRDGWVLAQRYRTPRPRKKPGKEPGKGGRRGGDP